MTIYTLYLIFGDQFDHMQHWDYCMASVDKT